MLNIGAGEAASDGKKITQAVNDLTAIAGQKAIQTRSKKAIAQFKIREGLPIGAKVTLRGDLMYEFVDRLITTALPRVRDFRGINPKSFDGRGNYAMGTEGTRRVPRKSTTTRRNPCGVWTSCSTPRRRPTKRPGRFSKASSSRSRRLRR